MRKRENLKDSKKGILFTLGLTFLTLIVLALAILIFHNAQKYEEIVSRLLVLDRVYELDTSIQRGLRDIFYLKSGISINVTDNGVTFEEILPNDNIKGFNNSLFQFKRFIESNLSNINLTITNMGELPLMITPANIAYKHKDNWGDIEVLPESINFNGYSLIITTDKNVSCIWDFNSGSLKFSLDVRGDVIDCEPRTEHINPSLENKVWVEGVGYGNILIIKVDNNGRLLINRTKDISINSRTTVLTNGPEVKMGDVILGVDFADFGVYKESRARIS